MHMLWPCIFGHHCGCIHVSLIVVQIFVSSVDLRDPVATYNLYQLEELNNSTLWGQVRLLLVSFSENSCLNFAVSPIKVKVVEIKRFDYFVIILLTNLLNTHIYTQEYIHTH